jgi:hypothetical protein
MRRAICTGYIERWEDRLYYLKHTRIAQFYFEHFSQRYGEAKSICLKVDAGVGFFSGVQYIISVKESEGNMLEVRMRPRHMEREE